MRLIVDKAKSHTKLPKVMQAALHLFVKQGIDGTTIQDIAKAAGVSEGALYRHFKSKDELAWHLFTTHLAEFTTQLFSAVLGQPTAEQRIRAFVSECFQAFEANQDLFTYLILSEHRELKKYPASQMHPGHLMLKIIQDGQKAGAIRKGDPYILGSLVLGGIIRICVIKIHGGIDKHLTAHTKGVGDMLWSMVRNEK
jgi:AcrR family transcriptional regulator